MLIASTFMARSLRADDGRVQRNTRAPVKPRLHASISLAYGADGLHKLPVRVEHITWWFTVGGELRKRWSAQR
jgi:hypothetical protein